MSTLTIAAERITAAGCSRAVASFDVAAVEYAGAASFVAAADFRGWGSNPTSGMQVKATKRHHLTPAPRPEEASP
ncbi:MAG TPA: hypothetical protein VFU19_14995 [Iamia sp.]|nr:hypothetical protein [Iamia sp.]